MLNDVDRSASYRLLCDFASGYVEAMFFTNGDTGDDVEWKLNRLGVGRLTNAAICSIKQDCDRFLGTLMPDGCFARQWIDRAAEAHNYTDAQAGRDLWFSRQGHGVGFWDRGMGEIGDGLHEAAKKLGEANVETWRGWICHR